ncbi:long chain acyl-CoA synthetase 6, partial [Blastocystis sp. ATCC 50177/Nand II]
MPVSWLLQELMDALDNKKKGKDREIVRYLFLHITNVDRVEDKQYNLVLSGAEDIMTAVDRNKLSVYDKVMKRPLSQASQSGLPFSIIPTTPDSLGSQVVRDPLPFTVPSPAHSQHPNSSQTSSELMIHFSARKQNSSKKSNEKAFFSSLHCEPLLKASSDSSEEDSLLTISFYDGRKGSLDLSTRVGDGLASEGSLTEGKSVLFGDWKQYVPQEEKSVLSTQDGLYDELNRTLQEGLSEEEVEASNENEVTIQELDAVLKEDEESEGEASPVLPSLLERSEKASPVIPSVSEKEEKLSVSGSEEKLSVSQSEAKASSQSEVMEGFISTSPPRHATLCPSEDVCTICYTSGTTGVPKGVLVTHRNLIAALSGCLYTGICPVTSDCYLSYLPMAHVLERVMQLAMLIGGASVGFYQGSTRTIMDDIRTLRPTVFTSVPRLLNKIYDALTEKIKQTGYVVQSLWSWGIAAKQWRMENGYDNSHWFYDWAVFDTIRAKAGLDRVRVTISGSAPLSKDILLFLRCLLKGVIIEGYGATETSGPMTLQVGSDYTIGNVGGALPCCEYKLVDVPEMNYLTSDRDHNGQPCKGRGELFVRGYNITPGYFRAPELTKKAFDKDGFFSTGDIAIILPNYSLKIVDRKKNFF